MITTKANDVRVSESSIIGRAEKRPKFASFRNSVSADLSAVTVDIIHKSIVGADGSQLSPEEQLDIVASYQLSSLPFSVERIVSRVNNFIVNDFEVDVRYVPSDQDPHEKASQWLKTSLYHGLCGLGNSFSHDGKHYHVMSTSTTVEYTGESARAIAEGTACARVKSNGEKVSTVFLPTKEPQILIPVADLAQAMKEVIQRLNITVTNGTISIQGKPVRQWIKREVITASATVASLSDIDLGF